MLESLSIPTILLRRAASLAASALLLAAAASQAVAQAPCPNENRLYFSDSASGPAGFVNRPDGTFTFAPAPGFPQAEGLAVNRSLTKAYVVYFGTNELREIDLATGGSVVITSSLNGPRGIELNPAETDAWVTNETGGTLVSVNLATGMVSTVATGLNAPRGFVVDSNQTTAYVAESASGSIARVILGSGSVLPGGIMGISTPRDVAMNFLNSQLYITDTAAGTLYQVSAFGGMATPVTSLLFSPIGVAVDASASNAFVAENGGFVKQVPLFGGGSPFAVGFTSGSFAGLDLASSPCQIAGLSPSTQAPGTGSRIAVCLHIDMRNSAEVLGSYGATIAWDPSVLGFVSAMGGDPPFDTPIINAANAAIGSLAVADADATGAAGAPHVLCVEYDVNGPTNSSTLVNLTLTSITGAGTFADLSSTAVANDIYIDVQGLCIVGDVNGNDLINSGDALIILSHEIMLPIPGNIQVFLDGKCGDANGDSLTNSTDSNIVLTHEVGLPIAPGLPFNAPLQTFESCPSCSAPPPAPLSTAPATEAASAEAAVAARVEFSAAKPRKGEIFEVRIFVDLTASGDALGSYGAQLEWPAGVADFLGVVRGLAGGFPLPLVNPSEAAQGVLRFAQANPSGASGDVELVRMQFRARHALPKLDRTFQLKFSSLGAPGPAFHDLLPFLVQAQAPQTNPGP